MARRRSLRAPLIAAGVIAFLLADLALVIFALQPRSGSDASAAVAPAFTALATPTPSVTPAIPTATATAAPSASPTVTPAPSATGTATSVPTPAPTATSGYLQGFADANVGYRATPGSCSGPDSVIQLTTDGGKTWTNVNPTDLRIREVDSIVVVDSDHVDLLARYGDSCTLSDVSTYTQGEFWQAYPDRTAQLQN